MPTSLLLTRAEARRAVGQYLAISLEPADWEPNEKLMIADGMKSGERTFYAPAPLPGERTAHMWSFLRPVLTMPTVADQGDYDLPSGFGGFVSSLAFPSSDAAWGHPLRQTGIGELLALRQYQSQDYTAQPTHYAVHPLPTDGSQPLQWQLSLHPRPDRQYLMTGAYFIDPTAMSDDEPYPLGGQPHSETLLESILAAIELKIEGIVGGPHAIAFAQRLAASVSIDRQATTPRNFGYNADRSDDRGRYYGVREGRAGRVTYNGAVYDGGD